MKKWGKRIGIALVVVFALIGLKEVFKGASGPALGVVDIAGTMWVADDWVEKIEAFRKDSQIVGVVVRINSPGGVVAASQEIFESLKKLSVSKPVVASMGSIAASGGLYVAMGAGKILADAGTLTGSIGVRMEHVNIGDLLSTFKIQQETIKSGRFKDLASNTRALLPEERELLTGMMEEIHQQFKEVVATSRGLELGVVELLADGRIFSGAKAKELGLVDEIGGFTKAVEMAAGLAKIKGEPRLVFATAGRSWWFKNLLGTLKAWGLGPQVCYLL